MPAPKTYCYPFEVVSVYDGDTLTVNVDVGFGWTKRKVKCRIKGIDTPEIRGSSAEEKVLARAAKAFLEKTLREADQVVLRSLTKPDKYGRCIVAIWVDGVDITELLIAEEHARAYEGGAKLPWV